MGGFMKKARATLRDEQGITGLETAIILIAFVVVATVFAFIVLTTGIFSAERGKETVYAGLQKARGTLEVRGGIVATSTAPPTVDKIQFQVSTTAGGDPIPLDPAATTNRTVIAYRDAVVAVADVPYTVTVITGNTDNLLEPGELIQITINVSDIPGAVIAADSRWTLEIQTPVGAVIDLTRSMPAAIAPVMQLH